MAEKNIESIDGQMNVIKNFLDEFYNKTVFRIEGSSAKDMTPSLIKFIFAFDDPETACPIGELGKNARVKSSTMTDIVDRMEKDGIAARIRDDHDRRLVKVRLTKKGLRIRSAFYERRRSEFVMMFKQLDSADVDRFINCLQEATAVLRRIE